MSQQDFSEPRDLQSSEERINEEVRPLKELLRGKKYEHICSFSDLETSALLSQAESALKEKRTK